MNTHHDRAWQIIKKGLLSTISIKNHPSLFRLLQDGENLQDLTKLPPEQVLLRWVNFQLGRAGSATTITNFGAQLKDSSVYDLLLHQVRTHAQGNIARIHLFSHVFSS